MRIPESRNDCQDFWPGGRPVVMSTCRPRSSNASWFGCIVNRSGSAFHSRHVWNYWHARRAGTAGFSHVCNIAHANVGTRAHVRMCTFAHVRARARAQLYMCARAQLVHACTVYTLHVCKCRGVHVYTGARLYFVEVYTCTLVHLCNCALVQLHTLCNWATRPQRRPARLEFLIC